MPGIGEICARYLALREFIRCTRMRHETTAPSGMDGSVPINAHHVTVLAASECRSSTNLRIQPVMAGGGIGTRVLTCAAKSRRSEAEVGRVMLRRQREPRFTKVPPSSCSRYYSGTRPSGGSGSHKAHRDTAGLLRRTMCIARTRSSPMSSRHICPPEARIPNDDVGHSTVDSSSAILLSQRPSLQDRNRVSTLRRAVRFTVGRLPQRAG